MCTRLDIAYAIGVLGRYQSNLGIDHWKAAKKVMRYLQGTKNYMLMCKHTDNLEVIGYFNVDFVGSMDSRKVHFRLCIYAKEWSHFLEKHEADIDCYFYYGGRIHILF